MVLIFHYYGKKKNETTYKGERSSVLLAYDNLTQAKASARWTNNEKMPPEDLAVGKPRQYFLK